MSNGKLLIENDHVLYLTGLRDSTTFAFIPGASVEAMIVAEKGSSTPITGGGAVTLNAINVGGDTVGGDATTPTVVTSVDGLDVVVTVGDTDALDLAAGRLLRVMHDSGVWRLRRAAAGAVGTTVRLHLEPFIWTSVSRPKKVKTTEGEIIEIEDGSYSGVLDKAFIAADETTYWGRYTAAAPGSLDGTWWQELEAEYREC